MSADLEKRVARLERLVDALYHMLNAEPMTRVAYLQVKAAQESAHSAEFPT